MDSDVGMQELDLIYMKVWHTTVHDCVFLYVSIICALLFEMYA
jgi:hypothetical protein